MRLLPRFSLRFLLIALTVFLIALAGSWNYYLRHLAYERNTAHRAIVERLRAGNYAIEEDEQWQGHFPAKRVIGLISPHTDDEIIQAFLDLPHPEDLRRLYLCGVSCSYQGQDKLMAQLARCTSLERLYLSNIMLNQGWANQLKSLTKLRILSLESSWVSPGCQQFLHGMKDLEILCMNCDGLTMEYFEKLNLPKLRVMLLTFFRSPELRLSKTGFGRFPQLEYLTFRKSEFENIYCEAGALPQLEYLGIPDTAKPCVITWNVLPDAAPRLRGLAVHASQIDSASRDQLLRMPQLERLMIAEEGKLKFGSLDSLFYQRGRKAQPNLSFDSDYFVFLSKIRPPELTFTDQGIPGSRARWESDHWIKETILNYKLTPLKIPASAIPAASPLAPAYVAQPAVKPSASAPSSAPPAADPFAPATPPPTPNTAADPFAPAPAPSPPPPDPAWLKNFGPAKLN